MVWNLTKPEVKKLTFEDYDFYLTENWSNGGMFWAKLGTKFIFVDYAGEPKPQLSFNLEAIDGEYYLVPGSAASDNKLINIRSFANHHLQPVSKKAQEVLKQRKWKFINER